MFHLCFCDPFSPIQNSQSLGELPLSNSVFFIYCTVAQWVQNERKCDFGFSRLLGLFQRLRHTSSRLSPAELRHPSGSPPPPHQSPLPPPPPPPTASPPAREPAAAAVASPTAGQAVSLPSSSTGLRRVFNGEVGKLRQYLAPACRHHLAGPSISRAKGLSHTAAACLKLQMALLWLSH